MDQAERKRLKQQGKQMISQRSQQVRDKMSAENPWPTGSAEWVARYKDLYMLRKQRAERTMELYKLEGNGSGGVRSDFYVSCDREALSYADAPECHQGRLEYKGITPLELSVLWAIMRGIEWDSVLMDEFPCLLDRNEGNCLIHRLPGSLLADLAGLGPERMTTLASKWADTDELRWPAPAAHEVVHDLAKLARRAIKDGRSVYLWNCT